jgi:hypothetical protein
MLKSDGAIILTVPAHMSLWSYFDVASCRIGANSRGKRIRRIRGRIYDQLLPLLWLWRRLHGAAGVMERERASEKAANELTIVPIFNGILKLILSSESSAIQRRWQLPLHTSLLAIARKK